MNFSRATENSYFGFQTETRLLSGHLKMNACNSINNIRIKQCILNGITFDERLVRHFSNHFDKKFSSLTFLGIHSTVYFVKLNKEVLNSAISSCMEYLNSSNVYFWK